MLSPVRSMATCDIKGRVHSTESFGTVDGPGIRYVIFLQGCPMRCLYCHNPDSWEINAGTERSVNELLAEYETQKSFYRGGGITVTGGEPLLQIDFVTALFEEAKKRGIHTCVDTSGVTFIPEQTEAFDRLVQVTDLVMLDIKQIDTAAHRELTGHSNQRILAFAKYLERKKVPVWIRYVVVPGYTDRTEDLKALGHFLAALTNVKALDVLPYHDMGKAKYEAMAMKYPLEGVKPLSKEQAVQAREVILSALREARGTKRT